MKLNVKPLLPPIQSLHKKWSFPIRISSIKESLMKNFMSCAVNAAKIAPRTIYTISSFTPSSMVFLLLQLRCKWGKGMIFDMSQFLWETATRGVLWEKQFSQVFQHLCWSLFLIKFCIKRETPTQVFSCKYCEIFENTYFEKHLRTAASTTL